MSSPKKIAISFSSKEIIFSFFILVTVSLVVFGVGLYIGMDLHEKTEIATQEQIPPLSENSEETVMTQTEKPVEEPQATPPPLEPPLTEQEPPQELPKKLLAEELEPTLPKTTSLFVSDENLKTLAEILKSGTYTLKLGTYAKIDEAITLRDKIKNNGFPAVYYCPQEDASTVSVCLGGFSNEEKAQDFAAKLQKKSIISQFEVHKLN